MTRRRGKREGEKGNKREGRRDEGRRTKCSKEGRRGSGSTSYLADDEGEAEEETTKRWRYALTFLPVRQNIDIISIFASQYKKKRTEGRKHEDSVYVRTFHLAKQTQYKINPP